MSRISVKNWRDGLIATWKRFTGSDIASSDRLLLSTTLFQLILLFVIAVGIVIYFALPTRQDNAAEWRTFFLLIVCGTAGYFFVSRQMLSRIKHEMRRHTQFISDASHELRTPLTIMKTQLEIAMKHDDSIDQREAMADTLQEVDRMQRIVEDLLLLSKNYLSDKNRATTTTHLNHLLEEVVRKLQPYAASKKVQLILMERSRHTREIIVRGDSVRLSEAFLNVVRNSIDYSKSEGGVVTVRLNQSRATDYYVSVKVADNGIGIEAHHLPHIFNRFYQADKSRALKEGGGSGLGLAITKSIIEHFGGRIELASKPNVGTTVTIQLEWAGRI